MKPLLQFLFLWGLLTITILVGCEESSDDKINQAQACLNQANTSSAATTCLTHIEGMSGQKAARIRCALTFLVNGLTQQQIVNTFKNLETPPTSDSPFAYLYSGLAIGDQDSNTTWDGNNRLTEVDEQLEICEASQSASMIAIAHVSRLGTYTQKAVDDAAGDISDISDLTDASNLADLPDAVLVEMGNYTYENYCNSSNESNSEICETLVNAGYGTTTNAATLASNLRTCFANNSCN